jgi:DNA-binding NarL/FixJ family response regulator
MSRRRRTVPQRADDAKDPVHHPVCVARNGRSAVHLAHTTHRAELPRPGATLADDHPQTHLLRVAIVAEVRLYREGLARSLDRIAGLAVVGAAADRDGALDLVARRNPHVVLVDLAAPDGIGAVRAVASTAAAPKVVALVVSEAGSEVIASAEAGVAGYVTRNQSIEDVVSAMRSAVRNEAACSPRVATALLRRIAVLAGGAPPTGAAPLTAREREILGLIDQGLSNKQIARRLCIQVATVKNHVHSILKKLGATRRGEAAARMRGMLVTDDPAGSPAAGGLL